ALASSWTRPKKLKRPKVYFDSINVQLEGKQPALRLQCCARIKSMPGALPVSISVEILDDRLTRIMQAVPNYHPFIGGDGATNCVDISIDLPPLIPGIYLLTFWIGIHRLETVDSVSNAIAIKITDSPSPDRGFPHYRSEGFIIPNSK